MKKFSLNSRVKELLADKEAVMLIEKHFPGATTHPRVSLVSGMKISTLLKYRKKANITEEQSKALLEELFNISK